MSVTAQTPYKKFTAVPGATLFSTGFRLILASDLVVKVNGVVVSTGFTVSSLGAGAGSDVTFGTPMTGGEIVELTRSVPKTRLTDYQQLGDYDADAVNNDFDRLVMMLQDSQFLTNLAVLLPVGDSAAPMTLPAVVDRALKFLAFDATGKAIASAGVSGSPVSTFMAAVILAVDAAAARTALGAANSGANSNIISLTGLTSPISLIALRSYLAGCTLSTAGASTTMSIAAGAAMDSTNAFLMQLSAISKTTSAWAVGSAVGGLDTGTIAINSWYHFYAIRRPDTGVVDVVFSLNATSPTLPANYTQFRRIGSGRTNGSSQWTRFFQDGDYFQWDVPVNDVSATNPGTAAVLRTLSVPTGVRVQADIAAKTLHGTIGAVLLLSDPTVTDTVPTQSGFFTLDSSNFTSTAQSGRVNILTNTSAQIRSRYNNSDANVFLALTTIGWRDTRGRDL